MSPRLREAIVELRDSFIFTSAMGPAVSTKRLDKALAEYAQTIEEAVIAALD